MRDDRYRIYRTHFWLSRYEVVRGFKHTGDAYLFCGLAITLAGAKRLVARCIRNDKRDQQGPVWVQPEETRP